MKATKDVFTEKLEKLRKIIEFYSDEEISEQEVKETKKKIMEKLEEEDYAYLLNDFRYVCSCLGQYSGYNIFVYDWDGEGIKNKKGLKRVLDNYGEKTTNKCYVIPVDVHY